jgi:hypothetical protein
LTRGSARATLRLVKLRLFAALAACTAAALATVQTNFPESHPHPAEGGRAGREAEDRVDAVPLNVAKTCTLTSMCASQNIHPNAQGYGVIAQAFAAALR